MSGKRYPEEFKTEAVKQVVDRGYSVASVATRLDITTHSLYAWIKKYGPDSSTNKNSQMLRPRSAVSRRAETGYRRTGHIKAAAYFAKLSD
ncbi:transposase family protein [Shigella flexneri]|nr:transposase family protein [Shigella flexneri]